MTSQRKIEANRRNGCKSRGPTSTKGKRRASGNARKYGLSVPILVDRQAQGKALNLAYAIAGKGANNDVLAQALVVAEIELELERIRQARGTAIETAMKQTRAANGEPTSPARPLPADQKLPDGFIKALPALQRIERYERRAYSRRKNAVARLHDLRLLQHLKSIDATEQHNQRGALNV
ncbi:MAG: hypothetical protein P8Y71_11175 [Pseudolabrys sp.]